MLVTGSSPGSTPLPNPGTCKVADIGPQLWRFSLLVGLKLVATGVHNSIFPELPTAGFSVAAGLAGAARSPNMESSLSCL